MTLLADISGEHWMLWGGGEGDLCSHANDSLITCMYVCMYVSMYCM